MINPPKPLACLRMQRHIIHGYLEILIAFVFGLSIGVWKPGIYISSGGLLLYSGIRMALDPDYRQALLSNWVWPGAIALFLLGIVACWIHPGLMQDALYYARKSMFILLIAPLLLMFETPRIRQAGLAGLLLGLWIAAFLTLRQASWPWGSYGVAGVWTMDVQGVIMALLVSFFAPFPFKQQSPALRIFWCMNWVLALLVLLLSSTRGPWLASAVTITIFLLVYQRKLLLWLALAGIVAIWPVKHFAPGAFDAVGSRVSSIFAYDTVDSNKIRLTLWTLGGAHLQQKWTQAPEAFWFGSGPAHHFNELAPFFEQTQALSEVQKDYLREQGYPSNDLHNAYLDSTTKMGPLWTGLTLIYLVACAIRCVRMRARTDIRAVASALLLLNFLIMGLFYDLLLSFAPFFLVFLMTLAAQSGKQNTSIDNN